ncbi:hypothetical protein D3C84_1124220 [compost metagenome]
MLATASDARVARRSRRWCSAGVVVIRDQCPCGSGRRHQAQAGQLLDAAAVLDQPWVVQRQALAQFAFQNGLQLQVVDLAIGAHGLAQFDRVDLGGSPA